MLPGCYLRVFCRTVRAAVFAMPKLKKPGRLLSVDAVVNSGYTFTVKPEVSPGSLAQNATDGQMMSLFFADNRSLTANISRY